MRFFHIFHPTSINIAIYGIQTPLKKGMPHFSILDQGGARDDRAHAKNRRICIQIHSGYSVTKIELRYGLLS